MSFSKNFQVAVVGGGVCGLTCTIALQRAGVPVQLFEAASAFGEIGAGIGVGPNAVRVLKCLGLMEAIYKRIDPSECRNRGFSYYSGLEDMHEPIQTIGCLPEDRGVGMHRAVFLDALVSLLDPGIAHFNKRGIAIKESTTDTKRLVIHFSDGTTHEADVVLGADGVRSAVRDFVLGPGQDKHLAFSNTVAYRGLLPYAKLKAAGFKPDLEKNPACFYGPNKHIIMFPIKNGEIINVVAFSARYDVPIGSQDLAEGMPWVEEVSKDAFLQEYEGWNSSNVSAVLECMSDKLSKWSIHVVYPPLQNYCKGRVAVLGDAAHAMLPHLGAGAGQGLEDAYALSSLLGHLETTADNLEAVLEAYSRIRLPRSQAVWEGSRVAGSVYDLNGPRGVALDNLKKDLGGGFHEVWRHDMESDIQSAIDSLRSSGVFNAYEHAQHR